MLLNSFEEKVGVSVVAKKELLWWKERLTLRNGRSLISSQAQIIIHSDSSLQGWGASCQCLTIMSAWSVEEWKSQINILDFKATKLAVISFTLKEKNTILVDIRMTNMTVLSYLIKMEGTKNKKFTVISKEILQHLLKRKIKITVEFLSGSMNVKVDRESRQTRDSSEWKLNSTIVSKFCKIRGIPEMDLFALRVWHHYLSIRPGKCALSVRVGIFFRYPELTSLCMLFPFCTKRKGFSETTSGSVSNAYNKPIKARLTMLSRASPAEKLNLLVI